jgi:LCP family protein required for cell wall assembly
VFSPGFLSFLRRFAIACVLVVGVTAVGVAAGNDYGRRKFEDSRTITIPNGILEQVDPGKPANYLLIGSDSRAFVDSDAEAEAIGTEAETGPPRSDVMMVLHVEPKAKRGMLVSFPRDLVVQIPGHSKKSLLNAAYSEGGPALVIQTLQQNFAPLKIHHYIEVDFRGFANIVNEIGTIHIWFPTPVHDEFTGLHIDRAGCHELNGDQALAYARSRHYNVPRDRDDPAPWEPRGEGRRSRGWIEDPRADLDRIPRQQYFLRTLSQAAIDRVGHDPIGISSLLDAVFDNFAKDQNLTYDEVKKLAQTFKGLNPAKVDMMTLPITEAEDFPGKVRAKYPDANSVIGRLSSFPKPPESIPRPTAADEISVKVVNGSGIKLAGARAAADFDTAGFTSAGPPEDADRDDYDKTQVRYAPGKFGAGFTAAYGIGTQNIVEAASAKDALDADVLVIVGRDYDLLPHNFGGVPRTSNTTTSGPAPTAAVAPTTIARTTTTTTFRVTVDTRFVPVDPKTGGPLVGCPTG